MLTQCDAIHSCLTAAAGAWVPMPHLAAVSASLNIHTRVDELRRKRGVMIENKTERDHANRHRKLSFYRIPTDLRPPPSDLRPLTSDL